MGNFQKQSLHGLNCWKNYRAKAPEPREKTERVPFNIQEPVKKILAQAFAHQNNPEVKKKSVPQKIA